MACEFHRTPYRRFFFEDLNYSGYVHLIALKHPKGTPKTYSSWSFEKLEDEFRSTRSLQYSTTKSSGACQPRGYAYGIDRSRIRDGACPIPCTYCDILGIEKD
jgi:hypothetical protein